MIFNKVITMKIKLNFGFINILSENIAEVIIDHDAILTLEMVEEYDQCLTEHFKDDFGLLINRINDYSYTYEAMLTVGSLEGLKATAVIYYNDIGEKSTRRLQETRKNDNFNLQLFSGLELGWQSGVDWLESELQKIQSN